MWYFQPLRYPILQGTPYSQHRVCGTKWWAMPTLPGWSNVA